MSEEGASFAVLGVDIEGIGVAVARHWGLEDSVLTMVRRQTLAAAPRAADGDDDLLRAAASCANESIDALAQPANRVAATLARVVGRYGRLLNFGLRELQEALQAKPGSPLSAAPAAPSAAFTAPMPLMPELSRGASRPQS